MRIAGALLIIVLLAQAVSAQDDWRRRAGAFEFKALVDSIPYQNGDGYNLHVRGIDITRNDLFLQHIVPPPGCTFDPLFQNDKVMVVEDVNFDGAADLRLLSWHSIEHYRTYWYWLFNVRSGSFERDTVLDGIMNPEFDHTNKVIHSWWRQGFNLFANEEFEYDPSGTLQLMWSELVGPIPGEDHALLVRTMREHGELKEEEIQLSLDEMDQFTGPRRRPR
ncbi:MAG: hypothetical protein IPG74_04685 [Flavobacteriales bacterium]|nr:hypothetical protein [Flavobacteriales bacterium]